MAVSGYNIGVIKFTSNGDCLSNTVIVRYFRWIGATTAGHQCVVYDKAGNEWWRSEADGANFIDLFPIYRTIHGLSLGLLNSGTFYTYVK